ncbi:hypothetical protein M9Y10_015869 [Tritrichomonas musculus]|uniref:BZIP domain-containing protein n=1 Tax=Tritrichomonas musculus TaxID=1915356 RepID=A0ABR2I4T6_9EUKA
MSFEEISHPKGLTQIDTSMFNETEVIKSLRSKQSDDSLSELGSTNNDIDIEDWKKEVSTKSNRGRKRKYATDEERILARRLQQKAYRERKKKELLELRALKAQLESKE